MPETDNRPAIGDRVRPADSRNLGTVTSRPKAVTYVMVRWDATDNHGEWDQQVTFAERYLTVVPA